MNPLSLLLPAAVEINSRVTMGLLCFVLLLGASVGTFFIARRLGPDTRGGRVCFILGLLGPVATLAVALDTVRLVRERVDHAELTRVNAKLAQVAHTYMEAMCQRERRLVYTQRVPAGEGVAIDKQSSHTLVLSGQPAVEPDTPRLNELQARYDELWPERLNQRQYELPLNWFDELRPEDVLSSGRFDFVEQDRLASARNAITVVARKAWWEPRLDSVVPPALRATVEHRLQDADLLQWLEGPVSGRQAHFALSAKDESTLDDRRHWVARARVQLVDRRSGTAVIDYLGFAAHRTPAWDPRSRPFWLDSEPCPGDERRYVDKQGRFQVVAFLLKGMKEAGGKAD